MKNLLYAVLVAIAFVLVVLTVPNAHAGSIATMPNQANGKVVLTDEPCKIDGKNYPALRRVYNYGESGHTAEGCYALEDDTVVTVWKNADGSASKMRYPVENFTLTKKATKGYGT